MNPAAGSPAPRLPWWTGLLLLILLQAAAWWEMTPVWQRDAAYQHGWLVPFLAAYLIWKRLQTLPTTACTPPPPSHQRRLLPLFALLALTYLPVWILLTASPGWRVNALALQALALLATWLWLWQTGGRALWSHLTWASAFAAVATPWPTGLESTAAALLMPANAALAVEGLHWLGLPAQQAGNLIHLPIGTLGVDEACSGLRSLQSSLMLAWFLGEWNRLPTAHRLLLFPAGILIALITNALRTFILSWEASHHGMSAAARIHDAAGWTALACNAVLLLLLARPRPSPNTPPSKILPPPSSPPPAWPLFPWKGPALCTLGLLLAPLVAHFWFKPPGGIPAWSPPQLTAPAGPGYRPMNIPPRVRRLLTYTTGWHTAWTPPSGTRAEAFHFWWAEGMAPPGHFAMHSPENCLTAAGFTFETELPPLQITTNEAIWNLRVLRFRDNTTPLIVLQGAASPPPASQDKNALRSHWYGLQLNWSDRLTAARYGWKSPPRALLELGLWGEWDREALARQVTTLLSTTRTDAPRSIPAKNRS